MIAIPAFHAKIVCNNRTMENAVAKDAKVANKKIKCSAFHAKQINNFY